ncbi:MAG: clostripain-related cysteine peptidase [Candidatus Sericytochromatia bacterium]
MIKKILLSAITLSILSSCSNGLASKAKEPYNILHYNQVRNIGGEAYSNFKISPSLPKNEDEKNAVKLSYFMSDTSSEQSSWSVKMISAMEDLPQKNVHNVVFRDGAEIGDTRMYYLRTGKELSYIESPSALLAGNINEVQSNNPKVFSEVLKWTFDNYKGQRKYLQLYTTGGGITGIGSDSNQTNLKGEKLPEENTINMIPISNFSDSIANALDGEKIDILYFRACMMGNIEALYELKDSTKYIITAEDPSYSKEKANLTMTKIFDELIAKNLDPKDIAYQMYLNAQGRKNEDSSYMSFVSVDMSKIDDFKKIFEIMAFELVKNFKEEKNNILKAYDETIKTKKEDNAKADPDCESMKDIWDFLLKLEKNTNNKDIKKAVENLKKEQKRLMMQYRDSFGGNANGLSLFMPDRNRLNVNDNMYYFTTEKYFTSDFAKNSNWVIFLKLLMT